MSSDTSPSTLHQQPEMPAELLDDRDLVAKFLADRRCRR